MHPTDIATWPRRYSYNEWRRFPQNQKLNEHESQELYRREALKYSLIEEELLRLSSERQSAINTSFYSLQSAVLNVFNVNLAPEGGNNSTTVVDPLLLEALATPERELMTEDGFLLVTEDLEYLIAD